MNEQRFPHFRVPLIGQAVTWRGMLLGVLYLAPPIVYFCLGAVWLFEKGLLIYGLAGWLSFTILFSILSRRWLKQSVKILPPFDWEKTSSFAPRDAAAWAIVQETAERGSDLTLDQLSRIETYRESSDELARRVAAVYFPNVENPLEKVPIVDLIVAIQLAAEDLEKLCRQIPVMDQLTPGHLKGLTKAMGLAQSANELYNFALPVFRPVTGIPRLLVQKFVAEPAWKNTQEGIQRWLFKAYVNRLGVHLVELCSGRLRAGSAAYRNSPGRAEVSEGSDAKPAMPAETAQALRIPFRVAVLLPGLSEKQRRERIGTWRHLADSEQDEIADILNFGFHSLDGIAYLPDLEWVVKPWPSAPEDFLQSSVEDPWKEILDDLMAADVVLADLRALSDDEALAGAQKLLDHLADGYVRQSDWPVAPIVLIADEGVFSSLEIHAYLKNEVRLGIGIPPRPADEGESNEPSHDFEVEAASIAAVATVLPLARQRRFAREMVGEARRKPGFRQVAGQVAGAAGKAGYRLARDWMKRRSSRPSEANAPTETTKTDDATPTAPQG